MSRAWRQAKLSAAITIPHNTATARSVATVMAVTSTISKASWRGTLPSTRNEPQEKVCCATTNITPTSAASGMRSISGDRNNINSKIIIPATLPDTRVRPPELRLIMVWPIIAQPPMPPNRPDTTLAAPSATHSRSGKPRVSVISSVRLNVSRVSSKPTSAISTAYGSTMRRVSIVIGTTGICHAGRPPAICAISPSVRAGRCSNCATRPTPTMATSAGGSALVTRGSR